MQKVNRQVYFAKERRTTSTTYGNHIGWFDIGVFTCEQMANKWVAEGEEGSRCLWTYPLLDKTYSELAVECNTAYEG